MTLWWKKMSDSEWILVVSPAARVAVLTNRNTYWNIACLGEAEKFEAKSLIEAQRYSIKFIIPIIEELLGKLKT